MPPAIATSLLLALFALCSLALAACGEDDAQLLPGSTAHEITVNLDTVRQLAEEGDCAGAEGAVQQVGEQVEAVEVDRELKRALEQGSTRLSEVVAACEEPEEEETVESEAFPDEAAESEDSQGRPRRERGNEGRNQGGGRERSEANPRPSRPATPPRGGEGGAQPPETTPGEGEGGGEEAAEDPSGGVSPANPVDEG